jgi:hypothetical protein
MRMSPQALDGIVNLAACAIGSGKIPLLLDALGKQMLGIYTCMGRDLRNPL